MPNVLTYLEVIQVCLDAGFPLSEIPTAVSVAKAESDLDADNHVDDSVEDSRGLWQIDVRFWPAYDTVDLFDPAINAHAALAISGGGRNWQPWSTFNDNSFKQYLPAVTPLAPVALEVLVNGNLVAGAGAYFFNDLTYAMIRPLEAPLNATILAASGGFVTVSRGGTSQVLTATNVNGSDIVPLGQLRKLTGVSVVYDGPNKQVLITAA